MELDIYIIMHMRKLMEEKSITCYALARDMGYKRGTIHNYLCGQRRVSISFIEEFCKYLNIPVAELIGDYDRYIAIEKQKKNSPQ